MIVSRKLLQYLQPAKIQQFFIYYFHFLYLIQISMNNILLLFIFFSLSSSSCLDPAQTQGSCTQCKPAQVLVSGHCYPKIRGCIIHTIGPTCEKCVFGYVLYNDVCIRQAVYNNMKKTEVKPQKVDKPDTLDRSQIEDNIAKKYGAVTSYMNQYLKGIHEELKNEKIGNSSQIDSVRQTLINIVYENYVALGIRSYLNQSRELSFNPIGEGNINIITQLNTDINEVLPVTENLSLFDIKVKNSFYQFIYLSTVNGSAYTVTVKEGIPSLKEQQKADLAFKQILSSFPYLSRYQVTKTATKKHEDSDFFIFQLSSIIEASAQLKEKQFVVHQPYKISKPTNTSNPPPLGSFSQFFNLQDERLIACEQFSVKQFPELKECELIKVEAQVVAGINFRLYYKKQEDNLRIKVSYGINKKIRLLNGQKNGQNIFDSRLEYNNDPYFLSSYAYFKKRAKVQGFPTIQSVLRKVIQPIYYYKVTYYPQIYAEFQYNKETENVNLISFVIHSENILQLKQEMIRRERSPEILMKFLTSKKPDLVVNYRVRSVNHELFIYKVVFVVESGTYLAKIKDNGSLTLVELQKLSIDNCFEITAEEIQRDKILSKIDTFLRLNYPINGFNLHLFQMKISSQKNNIRLLYSAVNLQQIQFYLQESESSIKVQKAFGLNYGYSIMSINPNSTDYKIALSIGQLSLGSQLKPFYLQTNGTHIQSFYKGQSSTYMLVTNLETQNGQTEIIDSREKLLFPMDFNSSHLLSQKQRKEDEKFAKVKEKLKTQAVSLKMEEIKIKYVQKTQITAETRYKVFFESSDKYYHIQALYLNESTITFGPLVVSVYKIGDFTTCTQFNKDYSACLLCKQDQLEYQGVCYGKMVGCLIQAGKICIRCDAHYVKIKYKCRRDCSYFLKGEKADEEGQ